MTSEIDRILGDFIVESQENLERLIMNLSL